MHIKVVTKDNPAFPEADVYIHYLPDLDKHVINADPRFASVIRGKDSISYSETAFELIITTKRLYDVKIITWEESRYVRYASYDFRKGMCDWFRKLKGGFRLGEVGVVVDTHIYTLEVVVPMEATVYIDGNIVFDGGMYAYQNP